MGAPRPYPGWEATGAVELSRAKRHLNLRIDADVVGRFKARGRGYQTRINTVLRPTSKRAGPSPVRAR